MRTALESALCSAEVLRETWVGSANWPKDSRAVRQKIMQNPNCPYDLLWDNAFFYPIEVLRNVVLPLLQLEDPARHLLILNEIASGLALQSMSEKTRLLSPEEDEPLRLLLYEEILPAWQEPVTKRFPTWNVWLVSNYLMARKTEPRSDACERHRQGAYALVQAAESYGWVDVRDGAHAARAILNDDPSEALFVLNARIGSKEPYNSYEGAHWMAPHVLAVLRQKPAYADLPTSLL